MKTLKKVPIELKECVNIPKEIEEGVLYYSQEHMVAVHSCLCGCGQEVVTPIKDGEWSLTVANGKVTMTPSILQRYGCKSHYIITNGIANFV